MLDSYHTNEAVGMFGVNSQCSDCKRHGSIGSQPCTATLSTSRYYEHAVDPPPAEAMRVIGILQHRSRGAGRPVEDVDYRVVNQHRPFYLR